MPGQPVLALHNGAPGFGEIATSTTAHAPPATSPAVLTGAQLRFDDADGNGRYGPGDRVYFMVRPETTVKPGMLRLVATAGGPAGTAVGPTSADVGRTLLPAQENVFCYTFAYHDGDGDLALGAVDTVYIVTGSGPSLTCGTLASVTPGWIRLSSFGSLPAGTAVVPGDADANRQTTTAGIVVTLSGAGAATGTSGAALNWALLDRDGDGAVDSDDELYWHLGRPAGNEVRRPHPNDVVVGGAFGAGKILGLGDDRVALVTTKSGFSGVQVRYHDASGNKLFDAGEPLYLLVAGADRVPANAVRLASTAYAQGSKVSAMDGDHDQVVLGAGIDPSVSDFGYNLRYADTDRNGAPSAPDTVYLATCRGATHGPACNAQSNVEAGWVRFGGTLAGPVRATDADHLCPTTTTGVTPSLTGRANGNGATAAEVNLGYVDLARDGTFNGPDLLFWHPRQAPAAGSYELTPGDVGLTASGQPSNPIPGCAPEALFTVSAGDEPLKVSLDGSPSWAMGGRSIVSYTWAFGDGQGAFSVQAAHTYDAPGTYTIALEVEDSAGKRSTRTFTLPVAGPGASSTPATDEATTDPKTGEAPVAAFVIGWNDTAHAHTLDAGPSQAPTGGSLVAYSWAIDGTPVSTEPLFVHNLSAGAHRVSLGVWDSQGAIGTTTKDVMIGPRGEVTVASAADPRAAATPTPTPTSGGPARSSIAEWLVKVPALPLLGLSVLVAAGAVAVLRRARTRPQASVVAAPPRAAGDGPVLAVSDIVVRIGQRRVVDGVSFDLQRGTVVQILGPSGSGKTTLVKAIVGLLPHDGAVRVGSVEGAGDLRREMGYVPQELQLHSDLKVRDNLAYFANQYGVPAKEAVRRGLALLQELGVAETASKRLRDLSGGQRRRVSIATSLVHRPRVVFLDEPTSGLDFSSRKALWILLQELARRHDVAVVATTHFLDDTSYADVVGIMADGRLVAMDAPRSLKERVVGGGRCIEIEYGDLAPEDWPQIHQTFESLKAAGRIFAVDHRSFSSRVFLADPVAGMAPLQRAVTGAGIPLRAARLADVEMEDAFVHFTGKRPEP